MKFSIKDFSSKCDQIRSFMENFIFCAVLEKLLDFFALESPIEFCNSNGTGCEDMSSRN